MTIVFIWIYDTIWYTRFNRIFQCHR